MIKKAPNTIDIDIQSRLNALKENAISFNSNNNHNNNNFLPPRPPPSPPKQDNCFFNLLFHHNKQLLNKIFLDQHQEYYPHHQHGRCRLMIIF